jgi:hypothetical protein
MQMGGNNFNSASATNYWGYYMFNIYITAIFSFFKYFLKSTAPPISLLLLIASYWPPSYILRPPSSLPPALMQSGQSFQSHRPRLSYCRRTRALSISLQPDGSKAKGLQESDNQCRDTFQSRRGKPGSEIASWKPDRIRRLDRICKERGSISKLYYAVEWSWKSWASLASLNIWLRTEKSRQSYSSIYVCLSRQWSLRLNSPQNNCDRCSWFQSMRWLVQLDL